MTQLQNLLVLLADDADFEVHVVIHRGQRERLDHFESRITWHEATFREGFFRRLIWEQLSLPVLARRIGAKVTYAQANYGPLLAPGLVVSLVNTTEVARYEKRLGKKLYWAALSAMTFLSLLASKRATAISEHVRLKLAPFAFLRRKITVIPPGIDPRFFSFSAVGREMFLLAVGDFYVQKNFPALAQAFVRLAPRFPELTLCIAGHIIDQSQADSVTAIASHAGIADRVAILGRVGPDQLADLYSRCAAFVFPSTAEAFGIPLAEAMAAGAPIVSSRASAMPEVAGEAAEYFDPGNVIDMAAAIERVLTDAGLREKLSKAGRTRATRFDRTGVTAQIAEVFKQAADR
ncbi:glycosyltransferase family 4 protein [Devosia sp.]|uniref:glycosyltransferase family 4 protein n=1 Tax=Devosia sp. TaxID=1871048 RepID=UPI0037BF11F7